MVRRIAKELVCLFLCVALSFASISTVEDFELPINSYYSYSGSLFTKESTPFGSKDPYIDIDAVISREDSESNSHISAILFHSDVKDYIGKTIDDDYYLCCWREQYDDGECSKLGQVLIDELAFQHPRQFHYWAQNWTEGIEQADEVELIKYVADPKEGIWRLYIVNCGEDEESEDGTVFLNGEIVIFNPYGHLPGSLIGFLPLYFILSFGYLVVGIIWGILTWKYRDSLMRLQHAIGFVIITGFLQNFLFALDHLVYNSTGTISLAFNLFGVIFQTLQRGAAFVCLLLVALGYTIIKPNLEKRSKIAVIVLGVSYLVIDGIYEFIAMLRYTPSTQHLDVPEGWEIFFLILVTIIDFVIVFWTFWSLMQTIFFLLTKKQEEKLKMFKKLTIVLSIAYMASLVFFIVQMVGLLSGLYDKWWKGWFMFSGYWSILYFVLLLVIGYIWRPSPNNSRYAYSTQLDGDGDLEMEQAETHHRSDSPGPDDIESHDDIDDIIDSEETKDSSESD